MRLQLQILHKNCVFTEFKSCPSYNCCENGDSWSSRLHVRLTAVTSEISIRTDKSIGKIDKKLALFYGSEIINFQQMGPFDDIPKGSK